MTQTSRQWARFNRLDEELALRAQNLRSVLQQEEDGEEERAQEHAISRKQTRNSSTQVVLR